MLYASGATLAVIACIYLLLRRGNAFAPDITTPLRLRRYTAAFFASLALGHLWYMPVTVLTSSDGIWLSMHIGALLDFMIVVPMAIVVLLCMLQDRRRPLWPVCVMVAPLVAGLAVSIATRSDDLLPMLYAYFLMTNIGLLIYMVRAVRQYGRWLRDNYADLEHKEVWQSFVVLAIILLVFLIYTLTGDDQTFEYILQLIVVVLIGYLLWRVETLSDLSLLQPQALPADERATEVTEDDLPAVRDNIGELLQQHCVDARLYLQHDLTVAQLAQAVGVNRLYLSQYFSRQGLSYNAYINDLRINHFVSLYQEAVAAQRSFTAQQLAHDSGYQSYSTFSLAFKQRMGQTVTAWIRNADK